MLLHAVLCSAAVHSDTVLSITIQRGCLLMSVLESGCSRLGLPCYIDTYITLRNEGCLEHWSQNVWGKWTVLENQWRFERRFLQLGLRVSLTVLRFWHYIDGDFNNNNNNNNRSIAFPLVTMLYVFFPHPVSRSFLRMTCLGQLRREDKNSCFLFSNFLRHSFRL
jgi:hypothetical protein